MEALPLDDIMSDVSNKYPKLEVKEIKLVKIDVEGAEVEVLKGAMHILQRTKYVIFEATSETFKEFLKLLRRLGFSKVKPIEISSITYNFIAYRVD